MWYGGSGGVDEGAGGGGGSAGRWGDGGAEGGGEAAVDAAAEGSDREGILVPAAAQSVPGAMRVQVLEERGIFEQPAEAAGGGAGVGAVFPRVFVEGRGPAVVRVRPRAQEVAAAAAADIPASGGSARDRGRRRAAVPERIGVVGIDVRVQSRDPEPEAGAVAVSGLRAGDHAHGGECEEPRVQDDRDADALFGEHACVRVAVEFVAGDELPAAALSAVGEAELGVLRGVFVLRGAGDRRDEHGGADCVRREVGGVDGGARAASGDARRPVRVVVRGAGAGGGGAEERERAADEHPDRGIRAGVEAVPRGDGDAAECDAGRVQMPGRVEARGVRRQDLRGVEEDAVRGGVRHGSEIVARASEVPAGHESGRGHILLRP